jgi:hypothetical protein
MQPSIRQGCSWQRDANEIAYAMPQVDASAHVSLSHLADNVGVRTDPDARDCRGEGANW